MSYQATVAVLLNKTAKDKMTDEIQKAFERVFGMPKELDDGEDFLYYLPYGKWAWTAKEERSIFAFLHSLDDEDGEWEFCLTGDNDTQEHEGNTDYERLCVETYMSLDGTDIHSIVEEKAQEKEAVHLLHRSLTDVRLVIDGKLYCTEPTNSSLSPCMFCDLRAWCDAHEEFENMCDALIVDNVAFKKKKEG